VTTPSQWDVIERMLHDFRSGLHTSFPARVLAYDVAAQTLDVRPALLRERPSDDPLLPWGFEQMPDLYAVPIKWPRAGGFIITFPIEPDDMVEVRCAEQSTMNWRQSGSTPSHPGVSDPLGLNGLVADVGWYPDSKKATNVNNSDFVIGKPDGMAMIRVSADGRVHLGAGTGPESLIADAAKLLAELVKIQTAISSLGGAYLPPALASMIALSKASGY
jgi:hypothetical protein